MGTRLVEQRRCSFTPYTANEPHLAHSAPSNPEAECFTWRGYNTLSSVESTIMVSGSLRPTFPRRMVPDAQHAFPILRGMYEVAGAVRRFPGNRRHCSPQRRSRPWPVSLAPTDSIERRSKERRSCHRAVREARTAQEASFRRTFRCPFLTGTLGNAFVRVSTGASHVKRPTEHDRGTYDRASSRTTTTNGVGFAATLVQGCSTAAVNRLGCSVRIFLHSSRSADVYPAK